MFYEPLCIKYEEDSGKGIGSPDEVHYFIIVMITEIIMILNILHISFCKKKKKSQEENTKISRCPDAFCIALHMELKHMSLSVDGVVSRIKKKNIALEKVVHLTCC